MDCEDCRHLTVVGLHDTGPRSLQVITDTDSTAKCNDVSVAVLTPTTASKDDMCIADNNRVDQVKH